MLSAFWLDVKLFMVVELVVLVLGLVIALARVSRAPALFPLRLLAVLYTDVLRGVPTILLVFLVGLRRARRCDLVGCADDPVILGGAALALSYSALRGGGLPRRDPAPCIRASAPPRSRSGSPRRRRCAT